MARLRYNGLTAALGSSLTSGATSVTFAAALTHNGGVAVPTLSGSDYIPLSLLDAAGRVAEVVYLTAYTSGATSGTITRGRENTAGVAHSSGAVVLHAPTTWDVPVAVYKSADEVLSGTSTLQNDDHLLVPIAANQTMHVDFTLFVAAANSNQTADFKCSVAVPSGATVRWSSITGPGLTANSTESTAKIQGFPGAVALSAGVPETSIADAVIRYTATVENGATAGLITLQWAPNASQAGTTTVKRGSVAVGYPMF